MGTTQGYFLSWWQLLTVKIGQPNKMLRALRITKGSRQLLAPLMEILVIGDNHKVSNLVFSLCISEHLDKTRDTAMSLLHCSPQPTLVADAKITCRPDIPLLNAALRHSVPSQIFLSIMCGFVASYIKQHWIVSCTVAI